MANQTDPQFRLAELFKQKKCYTIDELQISATSNYVGQQPFKIIAFW